MSCVSVERLPSKKSPGERWLGPGPVQCTDLNQIFSLTLSVLLLGQRRAYGVM